LLVIPAALNSEAGQAGLSTAKLVIDFDLACFFGDQGFHSPLASGSLFLQQRRKSNQKDAAPDAALAR
jgi:hypothetical protein